MQKKPPVFSKKAYPSFEGLFFSSLTPSLSLPNLYQEIEIYYVPKRPEEQQERFFLILKRSQQKKKGVFWEKIPLFYDERGQLCFQEKESFFWIRPEKRENHIVVESVLQDGFWEKQESFTFPLLGFFPGSSVQFLQKINRLHYLGKDLWQEKQGREIFVFEQGKDLLFIGKQSLWTFDQGIWREKKKREKAPILARIREEKKEGLLVEFWGEEGEYERSTFPVREIPPNKGAFSEIETCIQPFSLRKIVCNLTKKLLFLKEKESLFKSPLGWEKAAEKGEGPGEVFFFDTIQWKGLEKIIYGELFDFTHTKKQKVEISFHKFSQKSLCKKMGES